jgi:hypothetical protein
MKERLSAPRVVLFAAVLISLTMMAMPPLSRAGPQRAEFMVVNKSDWDIHGLYLSATQAATWGPDQLGDKIIAHGGGTFTLHGIPCGHYDIKLVDDDGEACVIEDVVMCKDHTHWDVTNEQLARCEGWGNSYTGRLEPEAESKVEGARK